MEVGMLPSPTGIADDVSLEFVIYGSNLYWISCLQVSNDEYAIAFQIYRRIAEILVGIHSHRKCSMFRFYAHVQTDHMIEGLSR